MKLTFYHLFLHQFLVTEIFNKMSLLDPTNLSERVSAYIIEAWRKGSIYCINFCARWIQCFVGIDFFFKLTQPAFLNLYMLCYSKMNVLTKPYSGMIKSVTCNQMRTSYINCYFVILLDPYIYFTLKGKNINLSSRRYV